MRNHTQTKIHEEKLDTRRDVASFRKEMTHIEEEDSDSPRTSITDSEISKMRNTKRSNLVNQQNKSSIILNVTPLES